MSGFKPEIVDLAEKVCPQTVGLLENLLTDAKAGRIHGLMAFAETNDGMDLHTFTDAKDYTKRIAHIEQLKFQWMAIMAGFTDE